MNSKKKDCFSKDKTYSRFVLSLDLPSLKELESIDEKKTIIGLISLYFITAVIVFVSIQLTSFSYFFYIPCVFLIAGLIYRIFQISPDEAAKKIISFAYSSRKTLYVTYFSFLIYYLIKSIIFFMPGIYMKNNRS